MDTLYELLHLSVICDYAVGLVGVYFRNGAERNG
jgi:hypothetical protein